MADTRTRPLCSLVLGTQAVAVVALSLVLATPDAACSELVRGVRWQMHPTAPPDGPKRISAAAVLDSTQSRLILFGGFDPEMECATNDLWQLDLSGPAPRWLRLDAEGDQPPARWRHTAVFDPVTRRMLVFGGRLGCGSNVADDLWSLSLASEPPRWVQIPPEGNASGAPGARELHTAVLDPVRRRMIVWAGEGSGGITNDCWAFDLDSETWFEMATTATPAPRRGHAAVYDPFGDRMFVQGGFAANGLTAETWSFDLDGSAEWTALPPGPNWAETATAVLDAVRGRMVLIGKSDEIWTFDVRHGDGWRSLEIYTERPGPLTGHVAVADPRRDRMVLYGGDAGRFAWILHHETSLWRRAPAEWPRYNSGPAAYDSRRNRLLIYLPASSAGLWTVDLDDTTRVAHIDGREVPNGTSYDHYWSAYDSTADRMIVTLGEYGYSSIYMAPPPDSVRTWGRTLQSEDAWVELVARPSPQGRYEPGHAFSTKTRTMLVTSGVSHITGYPCSGHGEGIELTASYQDTWRFTPDGVPSWTRIAPGLGVSGGALVRDENRARFLFFGGVQRHYYCGGNSGWVYNRVSALGDGDTVWTELPVSGTAPEPRFGAIAALDVSGDRLLVLGGHDFQWRPFEDVWELSLASNQWRQLDFDAAELPRSMQDPVGFAFDQPSRRLWMFFSDGELWSMRDDVGTSTLVSLVSADVVDRRPRIVWRVATSATCSIERRRDGEPWLRLSDASSDGSGYVRFEEREPLAPGAWEYRARSLDGRFVSDPVPVEIPQSSRVAIRVSNSGIPAQLLVLSCELPDRRTAKLELIDVSGRRVRHRSIAADSDGATTVEWRTSAIAAGLYFVRLWHPAGVATRKVVVAH